MRFILRFRKELRKATSANKIIIDKKEIRDNAREAREIEVETRKTKASIEVDARATTIATTTTITITNKKRELKLRKQLVCTHVNFVLEITLILLSCLLLFNNLREYIDNTLYSQKLVKLLN